MVMKSKRAWLVGLGINAALAFLAAIAQAETTFHNETPSNKVSSREAAKLMKAEKPVFKCRAVKQGSNLNPVVDPKAPTTWHTSVPENSSEASLERLISGQKVVKCDSVYMDETTLRVRKAD